MAELLIDETLGGFAHDLAAKHSVPGGGAASAYCGALAASLCTMVGAFTVGKAAYAAHEAEVIDLMAQADEARSQLLALMDQDGAAFYGLAHAYGMADDDPAKPLALEEGALEALQPPLAMMAVIAGIVGMLEQMDRWGSALLRSDVGCGAALAEAALLAASMNVYVNTGTLRDRERADEVNRECEGYLEAAPRARALALRVAEALKAEQ